MSRLCSRIFPAFQGPVTLPGDVAMDLDSRIGAELHILFMGDYNPSVTHELKQRTLPGAYCMDIGANLGFYSINFARWAGETGRVAAFEANPAMVERIHRHIELNHFRQIDIVPCAVHDERGEIEFYVSASPGKSSVHLHQVKDVIEKLVVQTVSIDEYVLRHRWPRLDILKLDIEGHDCRALLGGRRSLEQFLPFLIFEFWRTTPGDEVAELSALLERLGYRLEFIRQSGARSPFAWRVPDGKNHVDVICHPPQRR